MHLILRDDNVGGSCGLKRSVRLLSIYRHPLTSVLSVESGTDARTVSDSATRQKATHVALRRDLPCEQPRRFIERFWSLCSKVLVRRVGCYHVTNTTCSFTIFSSPNVDSLAAA